MIARARASAEAEMEADARRELAAARRDASVAVLQARRAAYELLRHDAASAALELRSDVRYPALLDRLEATCTGGARSRCPHRARPTRTRRHHRASRHAHRRRHPSDSRGAGARGPRSRDRVAVALTGRVTRVNGAVVEADGLRGGSMLEVVLVGTRGLPGEIIALRGDRATIQVYEYTGGLSCGEPVRATGEPLTAELGPGLLGGVFDGMLRPLADAPARLDASAATSSLRRDRTWAFTPRARERKRRHRWQRARRRPGDTGDRPPRPRPARRSPASSSGSPTPASTPWMRRSRESTAPRCGSRTAGRYGVPRPRRAARCLGPARHRAASARPPVSRRSRQHRRRARRVRHRQDHAAAADREVVRRRRDRVRRLRRARQRARRRAPRAPRPRGSARRASAARANRARREHLEHAGDGARGQHLRGR